MIDLHSHILPGVDDGSHDVQMSYGMLSAMQQQGVEAVVATPHFYALQDNPEDFLQRRAEAFEMLQLGSDMPRVLLGTEVAYFDGMSNTDQLEKMQLGNSGLLLVEMPFGPWSQRMISEICLLLVQQGLRPVLAHVDRYRRKDQLPRYAGELLEQGVLFQCNAQAFIDVTSRRWALGQLAHDQIHFLGSDTHNLTTRSPNLQQAAQIITKKLGSGVLEELTQFSKEMLKL